MAVLTLDVGGANLSVDCERAGHAAPRKVGGRVYGFSGAETSSIRAELMVVPVVLAPLPSATIATIRTLFALGAQVPCQGDVFNNLNAVIVCSGTITDELHATADRWTLSLTLTEVGTTLTGPLTIPDIFLTNVASPDGGTGVNLATADPAEDPFSAGVGGLRVLDAASPATCGSFPDPTVDCPITFTNPSTPEKVWLTAATIADGWLSGRPTITIRSRGGTGDRWQTQATRATIIVVRGMTDVATWLTDYTTSNGGFADSMVQMIGASSPVFWSETGDRFRIEFYGRLGLHGGYADDQPADLARQTLTFGNGGGGNHYGRLSMRGLAQVLNP